MTKFLFLASVFMILAACKTLLPIPIEPEDTNMCPAACQRLQQLGCPEGEPLPDGSSCESFCVETQKSGHALDPSCIRGIETCAELATKCGQ
jgi:hypothetical protein